MKNIINLPIEIINIVWLYLTLKDLRNIRFVCNKQLTNTITDNSPIWLNKFINQLNNIFNSVDLSQDKWKYMNFSVKQGTNKIVKISYQCYKLNSFANHMFKIINEDEEEENVEDMQNTINILSDECQQKEEELQEKDSIINELEDEILRLEHELHSV